MGAVCLVLRRNLSVALLGCASAALLVTGCGRKEPTAAPASGEAAPPPPRGSAAPSAAAGPAGPHDIEVKATGWGRGTIAVTPDAGLACEDFDESQDFMQVCKGQVPAGETSVVVTLTPAPGASFGGWANGPCAGTMATSCTVPMSQDQSIVVAFQLGASLPSTPLPTPAPNSVRLGIDLLGSGTGMVTATPDIGLVCVRSARSNVSATCSAQVPAASLPGGRDAAGDPGRDLVLQRVGRELLRHQQRLLFPRDQGRRGRDGGIPPRLVRAAGGFAAASLEPRRLARHADPGRLPGLRTPRRRPRGNGPRVTWSVQEAGGGSVANGVYLAPNAAGTYHVVARSQSSPSIQSVATVTVNPEKVLSVTVAPGSGRVLPGGGMKLAATVTTSCGTFQAN